MTLEATLKQLERLVDQGAPPPDMETEIAMHLFNEAERWRGMAESLADALEALVDPSASHIDLHTRQQNAWTALRQARGEQQ